MTTPLLNAPRGGTRGSRATHPQVSGYVERIHVRPGDRVKEGQLLLEVDPRREAATLRSALQRNEVLAREGIVTRQEYERLKAEASEAAVRSARAQLQAQQVQVGYFELRAPFAGVVRDIPVKRGTFVTSQTALTRVDQSRALEASASSTCARGRSARSASRAWRGWCSGCAARSRESPGPSGAGAASRKSLGTAVFGGMLLSTFVNLIFIPVLYALVESARSRLLKRREHAPPGSGGQSQPV